ncbi:hypothetical protein E4U43_002752 [Claviceps pusilla]|uniref:Uncharacterized protein n=1 Tax=Claviceps pusilla TaxID=123648 RepID=A0A9P7NJ77_9HYPO|nr:hypothetical protein E4U43_002752 [Claviceps pusilla]
MFAIRTVRWPARFLVSSIGGGCVCGYVTILRSPTVQLDARPAIGRSEDLCFRPNRSPHLKKDNISQISSGSVAGIPGRLPNWACHNGALPNIVYYWKCDRHFPLCENLRHPSQRPGKMIRISAGHLLTMCKICLRYIPNFPRLLRLEKLPRAPAIYEAGMENPWFTLTFMLTYTLGAFTRL